MKIKEVAQTLERFAPLPLQDSYDNAGLQIGLTEAEASGVLLCLDVTEEVLAEAVKLGLNMVVAHHPLLFRGLKCVSDSNYVQRCTRYAIQNNLTVYAAHTNLDNVEGGVNTAFARLLGLTDTEFLQPVPECNGRRGGSGIIGNLPRAIGAEDFLRQVKEQFQVECLLHNALLSRPIRRVGICGGAGDFLMDRAIEMGADAFLTGEMHYHQYFGWEDRLQIGVLGHYQSERHTIALLEEIVNKNCPGLKTVKTSVNTNAIHYM